MSAIQQLQMSGCKIEVSGGHPVRLRLENGVLGKKEAIALGQLSSLASVQLRGCIVSDDFTSAISSHKGIRLLEVEDCGISDNTLKSISKNQTLTCLRFGDNDLVTDTGVAFVAAMKQLESISFTGCNLVTDLSLVLASRLDRLKCLSASSRLITGSGIADLARLDSLTSLGLAGTGLSDSNAVLLTRLQALSSLTVDNTPIGDAGASCLLNECRKLPALGLQNTRITDSMFSMLRNNDNIETIDVMYTNVTCSGLSKLSVLKGLRELYFSGEVDSLNDAVQLQDIVTLKYLYLDSDVSEKSRGYLVAALPAVDVLQ